ncbi:MAG TPA: response regulator [Spirochaetota bacterium]|nr:response regulator [Spirochaetota bacterium]HPP50231.1 response regulator [Spirochaetota bacterium]
MKQTILLVDDDVNVLEGYKRQLRDEYEVTTFSSASEALDHIQQGNEFSVIISDYRMPVMDGVVFLEKVKELSPDSVRVMLSGQADLQAVIDVINKGNIFRFLTKPCEPDDLKKAIADCVRQYELITAEKELLGKTLAGSIKVLTDLLALSKPIAFERSRRLKAIVKIITHNLAIQKGWQLDISTMLSQIGCVTIPDDILKKAFRGLQLGDDEIAMYKNHPIIACDMLKKIPRLEEIAQIIKYQDKYYDGSGYPEDSIAGEQIPEGARILKIAIDFDILINSVNNDEHAIKELQKRRGWYDEKLLLNFIENVAKSKEIKKKYELTTVAIPELKEGMYLAEDVMSKNGVIIGTNKQKITTSLLVTLKNYYNKKLINPFIKVLLVK